MSHTIALVGHCGPDSFMLRSAVSFAAREAKVVMINDQTALEQLIHEGGKVMLVNRVLDGGFNVDHGVELIESMRQKHPELRWILISNFPEAQKAAIAAGALPGFGKSEIGSAKMKASLAKALTPASEVK